jgi:two-component system C4-dicarboxylate transport sensor histidine kinase DctB
LRTFSDNTRVLIERGELPAARENLEAIASLTERMGKITNQLKLFVGRAQPSNACSQLARALRNATQVLQDRLRRVSFQVRTREVSRLSDAQGEEPASAANAYVPMDLTAEYPSFVVHCDSLRLEQALINLIGNALDALQPVTDPRLTVDIDVGAQAVAISVRDNGPGIDPEAMPRLFEPFFTTKAASQGLGLGLAIASSIARDCGGTLIARNEVGTGAVFVLTLRRAATLSQTAWLQSGEASSS